MRVTKIYVDAENITVDFSNKKSIQIDSVDYCEWYNDVSRETRNFKPLKPEDLNILSVQLEHIDLYLKWELGMFDIEVPDEVEVH